MELQKITLIYLEELKYLIKQKTYFFYIQICENYISRFSGNINTKSLNDFIISIKNNYSYSTTKTIKSLINRTLKYAFKVGLIIEPIEITVKLKKTKGKKIESLENFEQLKIEKYILENKKYYHYGILISLYTGIRLGELLSLNWKNINFKNKIINIDKTISTIIYNHKTITIEGSPKTENSIREIPISKQLLIILKELKLNSKSEFVITGRKYNQVQPRAYQKSFENLLNHLKIKHYGFHSLRHTFATRLLEKGVDIKTISELMGHSNPSITLNRYVHTNIKNKRKAVDVL